MTLEEIRKQIDEIDNEILKLLLKRLQYSKQIADLKFDSSTPIYDETRENEILNRLKVNSKDNHKYIAPIFSEILTTSKNIQEEIFNNNEN